MTKEEYMRIAEVTHRTYETIEEHPQVDSRAAMNILTNRMASMLSKYHPRFNTERFWSACDPTSISE